MAEHLTVKQKNDIILYSEKHPKASYADLKNIFDAKFKVKIGKSTISSILKKKVEVKAQFLTIQNFNAKRMSFGKYDDVENALKIWIDAQEFRNNPIYDDIIKTKAEDFAKHFGVENFVISNGTLCRFKSRKGLKSYNVVGEMAGVKMESLEPFSEEIKIILKNYDKKKYFQYG